MLKTFFCGIPETFFSVVQMVSIIFEIEIVCNITFPFLMHPCKIFILVFKSYPKLWMVVYHGFHQSIKQKNCSLSNQIKSNHFYCHITTAQVPWWVKFLWACSRQCRKTTDNLHMDRQCKKKQQTIYIWTDSAKNCTGAFTVLQTVQKKKKNSNLHMDRQCKKKKQQQFTYGQTVQKKQQQFTYGQYIFTDCTEDNVQNTHTCTQYA